MTWTTEQRREYRNAWNRKMRTRKYPLHPYRNSTHCGDCYRAYNRRRTRLLSKIPTEELRAELAHRDEQEKAQSRLVAFNERGER